MKCDHRPIQEKQLVYPQYLTRFFFRLAVFLVILGCYVFYPQGLDLTRPWHQAGLFSPAHLLCLVMICSMLAQHARRPGMSMGRMKQYRAFSDIVPTYDPAQLQAAKKRQNRGALKVLAVWLAGNAVIVLLFFRHYIGVAELVVLCAFYYLSDMICILFFCPFQLFLMGNQCCINCRIFAWGSWMMATPLVLIPSLLPAGVVLLSLTLLIRWEIQYHRHPERFWSGANRALRCVNCTEHLCRAKRIPAPGFHSPKPPHHKH